MAAAQRKLYEDFFDKTDAMGQKDGKVSIQELKKMVVEGLGQRVTDQEIAVSIKSGGSKRRRGREKHADRAYTYICTGMQVDVLRPFNFYILQPSILHVHVCIEYKPLCIF